jgi:hypothetical protein
MKVVETKDGIERRHEYRLSPDRARIYVQNSVGNADFAEINQGTKFPQPALNFETEIDTNYHYDTRTVTETSRKLLVFSDENFKAIEKIRVHDSSYVYSYDENVSNGDLKNPDFENALNYISDVSSILICQ